MKVYVIVYFYCKVFLCK